MEKIKSFDDKKEELACLLFADATVKNEKLKKVSKIYESYVNGDLKFPYDEKSILAVTKFLLNKNYFRSIIIPSVKENKLTIDENGLTIDENELTINYNGLIITPGKNIRTTQEYESLAKFLIHTSNVINNGDHKNILLINQPARKEFLNSKINELFEKCAEVFFNTFEKCYNKFSKDKEKILTYYDLFESYYEEATDEKYNDLMSKLTFLQGLDDNDTKVEIRKFIKDYANYLKSGENSKRDFKEQVLLRREENNKNDNAKNTIITYEDLDEAILTPKGQSELNELFDFVYNLSKEDFKVFAADPLSFFSHIDEEYRYDVINNFIIMMNKKDDFKMKQTIAKRLTMPKMG